MKIMHSKLFSSKQSGFSTLLLVLVLSLMLELMLFSMMLASRVSANRSFSTANSQESYFAAEGVLHDTLLLLRQGDWPPKLPYNQVVKVGDVSVNRDVTFDPAKQEYDIAIESEFKQAKRKLLAHYAVAQVADQKKAAVDVVLVLDTSGSMRITITYLKNAVTQMIDSGTFGPEDRIAVVQFSSQATTVLPFTSDLQKVKDTVRSLQISSGTNTGDGLQKATDLLRQQARTDVMQSVILFTDGIPTTATDSKGKVFECAETCFAQTFGNAYAPENGGNSCTDATIKQAQSLQHTSQIATFGVLFSDGIGSMCTDPSQSPLLGRKTITQIVGDPSRYFETNQLSKLSGLFQTIGSSISQAKTESITTKEVAPGE